MAAQKEDGDLGKTKRISPGGEDATGERGWLCQVRKGTETCGGVGGEGRIACCESEGRKPERDLWVPVSHAEPELFCPQDESGFRWLLSFRDIHGSNKTG